MMDTPHASRKKKAMNTLKQPAGAVLVGAAPIPASTAALAIAARAAPANCWAELITPSSLDSVVVTRRRRRVTSFAFDVRECRNFSRICIRNRPNRARPLNKTAGGARASLKMCLNPTSHVRCGALCLRLITTQFAQLLTAYKGKATLRPKHRLLCHA